MNNNEDDDEKEDPIGDALGLPALEYENTINNLLAKAHDDSARNDFEAARANLYEVIHSGKEAIDKLSEIASQSQHPRAFEVLAKLMDSTVQANKDLLDLQTKIRAINAIDAPTNEHAKTINNNLFVGSTAELQKMIKELNSK